MAARNKVLVTGGAGFIGSHLCERLVAEDYKVKVFLRYNSRNFWGWLETLPYKERLEVVSGDIRNYDSVRFAMQDVKVVFHLAALIGIPYSYYSPDAYVDTNIKGTLNLLQAARDSDIKRFVHTSTSEVYGSAQFVPIHEGHPVNPQSPYAATKAGADFLAMSFHSSFNLPVSVIRPFNTYGPRQSARAIIPTIITQMLSGKESLRLGSLFPTRDLTFVKDTVEGFIKAAESKKCIGEIINIGSNFEISIKDLIKTIKKLIGSNIKVVKDKERQRPKNSEVTRLRADIKKAQELLGFAPKYSLEQGLKETIEWFKLHKGQYKPGIYNV